MAKNNRWVVDSSYILSLILPDEKSTTEAKKALKLVTDPKNKVISSYLLEFEVGNGLRSAFLRKRIKKESLKILATSGSKSTKFVPW